ncbi:hypothetical protein FKM82_018835 [Ascaphus truei]
MLVHCKISWDFQSRYSELARGLPNYGATVSTRGPDLKATDAARGEKNIWAGWLGEVLTSWDQCKPFQLAFTFPGLEAPSPAGGFCIASG